MSDMLVPGNSDASELIEQMDRKENLFSQIGDYISKVQGERFSSLFFLRGFLCVCLCKSKTNEQRLTHLHHNNNDGDVNDDTCVNDIDDINDINDVNNIDSCQL